MGIAPQTGEIPMPLDITAMFSQPTAAPKTMTAKAAAKAAERPAAKAKTKKAAPTKAAPKKVAKPSAKAAAKPAKKKPAAKKPAKNARRASKPVAPVAAPSVVEAVEPITVAMVCDMRCGIEGAPGHFVGVSAAGDVLVVMLSNPAGIPLRWNPAEVVPVTGIASPHAVRACWDALIERVPSLLLVG